MRSSANVLTKENSPFSSLCALGQAPQSQLGSDACPLSFLYTVMSLTASGHQSIPPIRSLSGLLPQARHRWTSPWHVPFPRHVRSWKGSIILIFPSRVLKINLCTLASSIPIFPAHREEMIIDATLAPRELRLTILSLGGCKTCYG